MYSSNQHTNRSQLIVNSIKHSSCCRSVYLGIIVFLAGSLALSRIALAVCNEGCIGFGSTFLGDDAVARRYGTAIGAKASAFPKFNTANGANALYSNTTYGVVRNVAEGCNALFSAQHASGNMADGANALNRNTTGNTNVAEGYDALFSNESGDRNTAVGFRALYPDTGSSNIALGFNAGTNVTTEAGNICIGYNVLGRTGENNATRIGNIYSSVASTRAAYLNSDNKIGILVSSRKFKEEIKPIEEASEAVLALKPVTFRYKKDAEPSTARMFGLIAEDVEKVNPGLVTRNNKGEAETVRYEAVNAMLLNEFLKQHRRVEEQSRVGEEQDRTIARHQAEIRELESQLQKASDKLASINVPYPSMHR
jgi:endosialidase-like protein